MKPTNESVAELALAAIRLCGPKAGAAAAGAMQATAVLATIANTPRAMLHASLDSALDECEKRGVR